ncbi:hypothetical protein SAMN05421720_10793 [Rhodospira trueperi]|uniref:Uncharacterized protein n=1 Tax=Rhodospira trueperi TaxID=69960 RepID=A0A1G7D9T6_9PROT|nr:hypothetical protein SAMN05421720_10793 [Rhodospira trueperi]
MPPFFRRTGHGARRPRFGTVRRKQSGGSLAPSVRRGVVGASQAPHQGAEGLWQGFFDPLPVHPFQVRCDAVAGVSVRRRYVLVSLRRRYVLVSLRRRYVLVSLRRRGAFRVRPDGESGVRAAIAAAVDTLAFGRLVPMGATVVPFSVRHGFAPPVSWLPLERNVCGGGCVPWRVQPYQVSGAFLRWCNPPHPKEGNIPLSGTGTHRVEKRFLAEPRRAVRTGTARNPTQRGDA